MMLKDLYSLFRRHKMAMFLNVAGLAVAFAAFVAILIQVRFERNFDRCYPTSDRLFRVNLSEPGLFSVILPRGFIEEVIQSSPHIEAGTLITPTFVGRSYLSVERGGEKVGFKEYVQTCHAALPRMFGFTFVEGDPACLADPEKVIVPRSLADKLFGEGEPAVGRTLRAEDFVWTKTNGPTTLTIGGVYADLPENTQLQNVVYTAIDPDYDSDNFSSSNYVCYLLLDNAASAADVADNFNRHFDFAKIKAPDERIQLTPLTDIYYRNETSDGRVFRGGDREVTLLLLGVAFLIIVVAAINYTNFCTALTPLRVKGVNIRKVLGSSDAALRRMFLAESVVVSLLAWGLGLLVVYFLRRAEALPFIEADLSLAGNLPVVALSGAIAAATGLVAGLYPAYYVVSFPPALALKGSFGLSRVGKRLRVALIGVQFVISIVLIIGAAFVRLQNDYMRRFSQGFDKDQVAIVELNATLYNQHRDTYVSRLREYPGIEDVAFAMQRIGASDSYSTTSGACHGQEFSFFYVTASPNILRTLGIPVVEGRDFTEADERSGEYSYIFNRTAREALDMRAGERLETYSSGRIIGFTDDLKISSLRGGEDKIGFVVGYNYPMPVSYIRLKAGTDIAAAVAYIRSVVRDLDPAYPFDIEFYDEIFDQLYHKEENLRNLVTVFSLLAIVLSLVGVFGLVVFETQYRRKEIGIRKVHGATVGDILWMFNKTYLTIVCVCFAIAAPVAWVGVRKWLESFAYQTPMYAWVFLLAFLIVAAITLLTVSYQNWRSANENPVNSIKSE